MPAIFFICGAFVVYVAALWIFMFVIGCFLYEVTGSDLLLKSILPTTNESPDFIDS